MTGPRSLGARLIAGAAVFVVLALLVAGGVIDLVLDRFVRGQIDQRLDGQIHSILDALRPDPPEGVVVDRNVDAPPFDRIRSGWYWQVAGPRGPVAGSRSLHGAVLPPPVGPVARIAGPPPPPPVEPDTDADPPPPHHPPEPPTSLEIDGPGDMPLHVRAVTGRVGPIPVVIQVTAPVRALRGPVRDAVTVVALSLGALGLGLIISIVLQVRLGLRPLEELRTRLADVRQGRLDRIPPEQPSEIRPLVAELNALLDENAANLVRARRHVSNLAHGLKTPLATLTVALDAGARDPGGEYRALLGQMDRQIRHHLSRARSAALGGAARVQTPLGSSVSDLVTAFVKIHADKAVVVETVGLDGVALLCDRQDVDEMLGNLLDNACRWARERVRVTAVVAGRQVAISIEDDGPGLDAAHLPDVMRPGRRLDESVPGYGFGLPITRELAELYGGDLSLEAAPLGGLRAVLTLPVAQV